MSGYVWLVVAPEAARFNDEYCIWHQTVDVFTSRDLAVREFEARVPGIVWRVANSVQNVVIGEDPRGYQWALWKLSVDGERTRYPCHTEAHHYHRTRASTEACKAEALGKAG